jgi:hypothetical protein
VNEALTDYMSTIMCDWYRYLAGWTPSDSGATEVCVNCAASPFRDHPSVAAWPHDVVHPLLGALELASKNVIEFVSDSLTTSGHHGGAVAAHAPRDRAIVRYSTAIVLRALTTYSCDMHDVLDKCVAPKLDAFVQAETDRAIAFFEAA